MKQLALLVILLFLASCGVLSKKTVAPISNTNYWSVMVQKDNVYTIAFPTASNGVIKNRDLHYIMIDKNILTNDIIISIVGGKIYNSKQSVILEVNDNKYYLPVYKDRAWLTNQNIVLDLINDLKNSETFTVINNFNNNNKIIDTYNLLGFSESYDLISKENKNNNYGN
ncbi:hypothetical protein ACFX5K_04660 [Rickettsiales bacterium LUAb2]